MRGLVAVCEGWVSITVPESSFKRIGCITTDLSPVCKTRAQVLFFFGLVDSVGRDSR